MTDLLVGASYPFRALGLLRRSPHLLRYVLVPIAVNVVFGITLYAALLVAGMRAIDSIVAPADLVSSTLALLLRIALVIGLLVVLGFVLVRIGVVVGSPWYSRLSARIEATVAGPLPPSQPWRFSNVAADVVRALGYELKKLLLIVSISLPLLALNLLPGLGSAVATVGGIALGATIACLDFLDPPLERRRLGFRQKIGVIRQALPATAGFGVVCLAMVSVPFVNLVMLPVCIAAGTLFYLERIAPTNR